MRQLRIYGATVERNSSSGHDIVVTIINDHLKSQPIDRVPLTEWEAICLLDDLTKALRIKTREKAGQ